MHSSQLSHATPSKSKRNKLFDEVDRANDDVAILCKFLNGTYLLSDVHKICLVFKGKDDETNPSAGNKYKDVKAAKALNDVDLDGRRSRRLIIIPLT